MSQTFQKNNLELLENESNFENSQKIHSESKISSQYLDMAMQIEIEEEGEEKDNKDSLWPIINSRIHVLTGKNSDNNKIKDPCRTFHNLNVKLEPDDSYFTNCSEEEFFKAEYHEIKIKTETKSLNSTPIKETKKARQEIQKDYITENHIFTKKVISDLPETWRLYESSNESAYKNICIENRNNLPNVKKPSNQAKKVEHSNKTLVKDNQKHFNNKPFACKFCPNSFTTNYSLKRHEIIHDSEPYFSCKECHKGFMTEWQLKNHLNIHADKKIFICGICNKRIIGKEYLKFHLNTHIKQTPFTCNFCDKSFLRNLDLTSHLRTHLEKRHFPCKLCNSNFTRIGDLNLHIGTWHIKKKEEL